MKDEINEILAERGTRYGCFFGHATISQDIKDSLRSNRNWHRLSADKRESLEMIAHKMARIMNGDPEYIESWRDIEGYSKLIRDTLETTEGATDGRVVPQVVKCGKKIDIIA